jgi:hypothetical protein
VTADEGKLDCRHSANNLAEIDFQLVSTPLSSLVRAVKTLEMEMWVRTMTSF